MQVTFFSVLMKFHILLICYFKCHSNTFYVFSCVLSVLPILSYLFCGSASLCSFLQYSVISLFWDPNAVLSIHFKNAQATLLLYQLIKLHTHSCVENIMHHIAIRCINTQWSISQTQRNFIMFIIVLGQHVSILIESSSGPSKNTDPCLAMFKILCGIPNAYILGKTMYKMYVSLCSYYTIRILISKTLTGTYEGGYACVFKTCCYRTLDIVIYTVDIYKICI